MLAYGILTNSVDKYLNIGASTALEYMQKFSLGVMEVFMDENKRKPNQANVKRILQVAKTYDFPSMLGSIDCMTGSERLSSELESIISKETL